MNIREYSYGTEKLVNPIDVGSIHYKQKFLQLLPKSLQRKIVMAAGEKASKMGFVVEPYALFLIYKVADPEKASKLLPSGFQLAKSTCFVGGKPEYLAIASVFRLHTSAFWGARAEFYLIGENRQTGLLSWVILDYISDTLSYDHKNGLRAPEATAAVVSTTCEGELLVDIEQQKTQHKITCTASLKNHREKELDERLWIEGNTSIAYGAELSDGDGDLFSLTFLPKEMQSAWEIPVSDINVTELSWYPEVFGGQLSQVACFPYAQHMLSDSPGNSTHYGSKQSLKTAAEAVNFHDISTYTKK